MFVRHLMKVALTVCFVVPLLFCRDLFAMGCMYFEYLWLNQRLLPDVVLFNIALQALALIAISLVLTVLCLRLLLLGHRGIDRHITPRTK